MRGKFDLTIDEKGQPKLLYIDKGKNKVFVGNKLSDFIIQKELGKGHFGCVYLVLSKITNKVYAMKEIKHDRYKDEEQRLKVEKEIKLLENLNHPHVITYFSSFRENGNFYIIIEYINGGSLEDKLKIKKQDNKLFIKEKMLWDVLLQILNGLAYLHNDLKIIHRDIKPDNILFDKDNKVKITDFGISAMNKEDVDDILRCHGTLIGPTQFMAPEMVNGGTYEFKSDIYMLGLTFFDLMSGQLPEKKIMHNNQIFIALNQNALLPDYYSSDIKYFVRKLLTVDVKARPSAEKAFVEALAIYTCKYLKFTSILSVVECFIALPSIGLYFKGDKVKEYITKYGESDLSLSRIIRNAFFAADPNNFNYHDTKIQCLKIRYNYYSSEKLIDILEIDVTKVIEDISNKLNKELNNKFINNIHMPGSNTINEDYLYDDGKKIEEDNEVKVMESAGKRFKENFRSKISDQLFFLSKTTYQCAECLNNIKYKSSFHCEIVLSPERAAIWLNKKILTINDLFEHFRKNKFHIDLQMYCKFCNKNQKSINVKTELYTSPYDIIIGFSYTNENAFSFQIEEFINLYNFVEKNNHCKIKYRLVGAIFHEKFEGEPKKYVSYTKDTNGQWKYCNGNYISNSDFNEIQNHEHIEALFYTSL